MMVVGSNLHTAQRLQSSYEFGIYRKEEARRCGKSVRAVTIGLIFSFLSKREETLSDNDLTVVP